jgi:protein TonB
MSVSAHPFPASRARTARRLALASGASLLLHGLVLAAAHWLLSDARPALVPPMTAIPVISAASLKAPGTRPAAPPNPAPPPLPREAKQPATAPEAPSQARADSRPGPEAKAKPEAPEKPEARARPAWTHHPPVPPRRPRRLAVNAAPEPTLLPAKMITPDPRESAAAFAKAVPVTARAGAGVAIKMKSASAPPPEAAGSAAASAPGLANPAPVYPWISRRRGEEGRVVLDVEVTPEGRAGRIRVKRSSGSARLDEAALAAVSAWRFAPALSAGRAVPSRIDVPITFRLTDR